MKKIIIAAAIVLSSGITALCITNTKAENKTTTVAPVKIEKMSVAAANTGTVKSDLSSAD